MTKSQHPTSDQMEEELTLARELSRGISAPVFEGYSVNLDGQRVNLWWQDRHCKSRDFSDAFVTPQNRLVLVVASVSTSHDATGMALSLRAFLRSCFYHDHSISCALDSLEHWARHDPQWSGICHLALGVLQRDHSLELIQCGGLRVTLECDDGSQSELDFPEGLPALLGVNSPSFAPSIQSILLKPGCTLRISSDSESVSATLRARGLADKT